MRKGASKLIKKSATNLARKVLGEEDPTQKIECLKNCLDCLEHRKARLSQQNVQLHQCPNCKYSHEVLIEDGPKNPEEAFALNVLNTVNSNDIMCYSNGNASIIYCPSAGSGISKQAKKWPTPDKCREKDIDHTETEISKKGRHGQSRHRYSPGGSPRDSPDKGIRGMTKDQRGMTRDQRDMTKDSRGSKKSWVDRLSESPRASPEINGGRSHADRRTSERGETRRREGSMRSQPLSDTRQERFSDDGRHAVRGSETRTLFRDSPQRMHEIDEKRLSKDGAPMMTERDSTPLSFDDQQTPQDGQEMRGERHRSKLRDTLPTLEESPIDNIDRRSDRLSVDRRSNTREASNDFQVISDLKKARSRRVSGERQKNQQYENEVQNEDLREPHLDDEESRAQSPSENIIADSSEGRDRKASLSQTRDNQHGSHSHAGSLHPSDLRKDHQHAHVGEQQMNQRHDRHIIPEDFRLRDQQSIPEQNLGGIQDRLSIDSTRKVERNPNMPRAPGAGSVAPQRADIGQSSNLKGSLKRPVITNEATTLRNISDHVHSKHGGIHRKNVGLLPKRPSKEQYNSHHTSKDHIGVRRPSLPHRGQHLGNKKRSRHVFVQNANSKDNVHSCHSVRDCCENVTVCLCCANKDSAQHGSSPCCCNANICCSDHHSDDSGISHENKENLPKSSSNHCCQIQIVHHPSGTCLNECAACKDPHYFERNDPHTHETQSTTMCNYHNLLCEQQKLSLAETGHHLHFLDNGHHDQVNPTAHKIRDAISLPRFDFENNRIICDPRNPEIHSRLSGHRFEPSKYSMYPVDPHILNLLYRNKEKYQNVDPRQTPKLFKDGIPINSSQGSAAPENPTQANATPDRNPSRAPSVSARGSVPAPDRGPNTAHDLKNHPPQDLRQPSANDLKNPPIPDSKQRHAPDSENNLAPNPRYNPTDPRYGPATDPRYGPATDPRYSPVADPRYNPAADPRYSPATYPGYSPAVDPRYSPTTDPRFSPAVDPRYSPAADPRLSPAVDPRYNPTSDHRQHPESDSRSISLESVKSKRRFKLPKFLRRSEKKSVSIDYSDRGSQIPERDGVGENLEADASSDMSNTALTGSATVSAVSNVAPERPATESAVNNAESDDQIEPLSGTSEQRPHQNDLYEVLRKSTNSTDANWWEKASQKSIGSRHRPVGHPNSIQEHQNFYHPNAFNQTDRDSDGPSLCGYDMFLLKHPELQPPPSVDVDANRSIEERMAEARSSFYKYLPPKYDETYLEMLTGRRIREGSKHYKSDPQCIYPELHRGSYNRSSKQKFVCSCVSDNDFDCDAANDISAGQMMMPQASTRSGSIPAGPTPMSPTHMGHMPIGQTNIGHMPMGQTDMSQGVMGQTDMSQGVMGQTDMSQGVMGQTHMSQSPVRGQTPLSTPSQQMQSQSPPPQPEPEKKRGFFGFFKSKESKESKESKDSKEAKDPLNSNTMAPLPSPQHPNGPMFMTPPPHGITPQPMTHPGQPPMSSTQPFAPSMTMPMPQQMTPMPQQENPKASKYNLGKKRVKSGSDYNVSENYTTAPYQANTLPLHPATHALPDYSNSQFSIVTNLSHSQFGYPDYSMPYGNPAFFGPPVGQAPVYFDSQFRIVNPQEQARWTQEKQNWRGET